MSGSGITPRLRLRTDGIWEIVWRDTESGKVSRKSCSTRVQAVAARKLAMFSVTGQTDEPATIRIGYLLDRYHHYLETRYSAGTTVPTQSKILRLKEYLGPLEWQEFSQTDVESYINHARMLTRWNRGEQRLSDGTIHKDLQILRAALRYAHLHRMTPYECRIEIRGLHLRNRTTWITKPQMRELIRKCCAVENRLHVLGFLLLGLATGARKSAILELRWDQIHIPERQRRALLDLDQCSQVRNAFDFGTLKSQIESDRRLMPVEGAYVDFGGSRGNKRRPHIPIGRNAALLSYFLIADRTQPYVVSYRGKRIVTGIKKSLEKVGEEARLPFKLTHHVLKRTCVTWMVREGIAFDAIEALTNTTVETLKRHYSHHSPDLEKALGDTFAI